jgi:hypothetical protein
VKSSLAAISSTSSKSQPNLENLCIPCQTSLPELIDG